MKAITGFKVIGFICVMIAIVAVAMPHIELADVQASDFGSKVYADDILQDPDVKHILMSSLFEDVQTSISHSDTRHPGDQELRDKCLNGDGTPVLGMINPNNNHCVEVIETTIEEGGRSVRKFLVRVVKQIDGLYNEITAFTDEWDEVYQVEDYLVRRGYMHMWSPH